MADKTQNKLEILIVEDREENRNAAKAALADKVSIDFAINYEDGLKKMQTKVYAFGIFDLELPRKNGMKTEKLGYSLSDEADKYALDHALITAGIDHHECKSAFVRYCWEEKIDDYCKKVLKPTDREYEIKLNGFHEMTEVPKTDPRAWQKVYTTLLATNSNVENIVESKKIYLKSTGKMYMKEKAK
jgi:response regulator RpfG family c-di-GMP phosphodiesterase